MKFKLILQQRDRIKSFVNSIHFLSKHAEQLIFIASEDKITILVEKPIIWIDIDINNFGATYSFDGYIDDTIVKDFIYFDINARKFLFPLDAIISSEYTSTELTLIKNNSNAPFLKIHSKPSNDKQKGSFDMEIPVIVVPFEQWCTFNVPRALDFGGSCQTPRYSIFRKYLDIYRRFKSLRFTIKPSLLILEGGSKIESRVMTSFKNIHAKDEFGKRLQERSYAIVDSKKLGSFFHSIHVLGLANLSITSLIKHLKYLKITFQNSDGTFIYNLVLENIEDEDQDIDDEKDVFEDYRDCIQLLDTQ